MANEHAPIDKSKWPHGPWTNEPDRVEWRDEATGLPCLIVRQKSSGHLCGYVAVPPGHALHGVDYSSKLDGSSCSSESGDYDLDSPTPERLLSVHGGVTYSAKCAGTICHVPSVGEPDDVWWFGFDCAHAWDLSPVYDQGLGSRDHDKAYRTVDFVKGECGRLAAQLAAVAVGVP